MRETDDSSNGWFSKWEDELPSPDELMPLSQSLITPDLALAFDISTNLTLQTPPPPPPPPPRPSSHLPQPPLPPGTDPQTDFADSSVEMGSGGDEPARTLKRPRLVWTPQLHKRFVDAVAHLGIKNAVPKTIMQLMSVDGLTRENVASHLQKYRLYLKRVNGLPSGGGGTNGGSGGGPGAPGADPATEHLFASSPVPPHFLHPVRPSSDHYLPFVPVAALQHRQMAAAAAAHTRLQPPYHRPLGQFGSPPNGQFEHPFLSRPGEPVHSVGAPIQSQAQSYAEDLNLAHANGGRKVLTLFPTGDD